MVEFESFGFYTINADYLQFLNSKDSEVYYNSTYRNVVKPFVGIVINLAECRYFIPLTSAKEKYAKWKNSCDEHFLIYEVIDKSINITGDIYKPYSVDKKMHVMSVLDIKKMIPIPTAAYERIDFRELEDERYRDLFQKETNVVRRTYCNFLRCEKALKEWLH